MTSQRFGAVLFDFDHTLFDSDTSLAAAYVDAARAGGIDDPEAVRPAFERINGALWRAVERGEISPNEVKVRRFEQLLVELGRSDGPEMAPVMADSFVEGLIANGELLPGAADLLDRLTDRPTALVTNGIGAVQRGRLLRIGLADRFDAVSISGELGVAKPDPGIFEHTFGLLGRGAGPDVAMVGDNWSSDVAGARRAGLTAVWLRSGEEPPGDPDPAVLMARSLGEVGTLLELA